MTVKKTLGAFADCAAVLDAALQHGTIRVPFESRGKATAFRQRCYKLRAQLFRIAQPGPGELPSTRYDTIYITIEDSVLTFQSRNTDSLSLLSRIQDADGNPIDLAPGSTPDFEEAAEELARTLKIPRKGVFE